MCPARFRTPPSCARSGKTWPGLWKSSGFVPGRTIARIVAARSCAPVPVVVPRRAVDRHRERGLVDVRVRRRPSAGSRSSSRRCADAPAGTDPAGRASDHEVDRLGRDLLGRHDEVALVLPVGVVDDDDDPARRGCPRSPPGSRRTPTLPLRAARRSLIVIVLPSGRPCRVVPRTSRSRPPPGSPGRPARPTPSVVTSRVCGISAAHDRVAVDPGDREAHAVDGDRALLHDVAQQLVGNAHGSASPPPSGPGRPTISPTPSTWPARDARRACGRVTGRSRFTGSPVASRARLDAGERLLGQVERELGRRRASTTVRHTPFTATDAPTSRRAATVRQPTTSRRAPASRTVAALLNDPGEHPPPPSCRRRPGRSIDDLQRERIADRREARPPRALRAHPTPPMSLRREIQHDPIDEALSDALHASVAPPSTSTPLHVALARGSPSSSGSDTPPSSSARKTATSAPAVVHASTRARRARSVVATSVGARVVEQRARSPAMPGRVASTTTRSGGRARVAGIADGERRVVGERRAGARPRSRRTAPAGAGTSARASSPVIHRDEPSRGGGLPVERCGRSSASRTGSPVGRGAAKASFEPLGLLGEDALGDLDPGVAQLGRTRGRRRSGSGRRRPTTTRATPASITARGARRGAAVVVAGLEGAVERRAARAVARCVAARMTSACGRAGAFVPALADDAAVAHDARRRPCGFGRHQPAAALRELQRPPHVRRSRRVVRRVLHVRSRHRGEVGNAQARGPARSADRCARLLPSRLSRSVPESHRVHPRLAARGVADCHRRWGIAPRPGNELRSRQYTGASAVTEPPSRNGRRPAHGDAAVDA